MKPLRLKLRWRVMISYLPLLITPIIIMGLVTLNVAEQGLGVLVTSEAERQAYSIVNSYAAYYKVHGSWEGVESLRVVAQNNPPDNVTDNPRADPANPANPANPLPGRPPRGRANPPPQLEGILIADTHGLVVWDDKGGVKGQTLSADALSHGAPIYVDAQWIGTLIVGSALNDVQQRSLLDTLTAAIVLSGLISALLSIGLGLWLSNQISAPIQQLMRGVQGLRAGQWSQPLPVRDSHELGTLTAAFNTMAKEITHQQQLQRRMVADIAHDLRTPLSVMALEVEGIRAGLQTPAEATASLDEEINWLKHLVDDLHTLSLIDADHLRLDCEPIAVAAFLQNLHTRWGASAEHTVHPFTLELSPDLPTLSFDPHRMRQIFGNLINNAFQHTPLNTPVILRAEADSSGVVIAVIDQGGGIAPEDTPHLFDRFYRGDHSRGRGGARHGSGLGLSIAYQLVALHGGRLTVAASPSGGATFSVWLPLIAPRDAS